jgi:hypothetical protein
MDFNKSVLEKINNLVKLTKQFDHDFKIIIDLPNNVLDEKNIEHVLTLTNNYLLIRNIHGQLIVMMNKLINSTEVKNDNKDDNDEYIEKMYEISTFSSLLSNISDLINNIDFQYKKIAVKYPKYINKKQFTIILITESNDENNEHIKLFNTIKTKYPENKYKIIISTESEMKKEVKKILNQYIKLTSKKLPVLYIVDGSKFIEIPLDKIKDIESIKNILD